MAGVPFIFGNATTSIPLSNLDANFNTGLTIGNTTVGLGNTVTTLGNVTLTNVNIVSGTVPALTPTSIANGTSNVSISSSGGNINVVTAGTIATFPAATGTVMVSGNMPAFSAYASSNTTLTNSAWTKVNFQTEVFDTNNNFASSRFTPTVAGYYQLNATVGFTGSVSSESIIAIYKNGSWYQQGLDIITTGGSLLYRICGNWLVDANGTTDYFEVYVIQGSSRDATLGQTQTYFTGAMVRNS